MGKCLVKALKGEPTRRIPVWLMRQAGRYLPEYRAVRAQAGDFLTLCYTPALASEVTLQPIRRFDLDAAIIFADILLVPHALGQPLRFEENHGPRLARLTGSEDLGTLSPGGAPGRLAPVYDAVARTRAALSPDTALIGFAGAPWTVATYMAEGGGSPDQAAALGWARRDAAGFQALIDILTEATVLHLTAQIEAGADAVQLFDTWAGALDATGFARWCIAPTRAIVRAVKAKHPAVPVIGFPRRAGENLEAYVRETGVDAVSLDSGVDLVYARDALQPLVRLQGNLDPALLAAGGEPMETATRAIVALWGGRPFVFNLGHGIVPQTPPENVAALIRLVREARP